MKCPMIATAILAIAAQTAEAADFSGRWVGKTASISSKGEPATPCDASLTISQTDASYTEALRLSCGHIRTIFEVKTLTIRGNDLLLEGAPVGSLTDTDVNATVYYSHNVTVQSQASQKDATLNLMIIMGEPGTPDPLSFSAALKRAGS